MAYTDSIRISDSEREQIVGELGRHLTAGRLTIGEFDQRVAQVYRSITRHEAQQALVDLPARAAAPVPTPKPTAPARPALRRLPAHQQIEWLAWLAAGTVNLAIWGIISVATGTMPYFWPVWVIGPWGLVLLGRTLLGVEGTCGAIASAVRGDRLRVTARS